MSERIEKIDYEAVLEYVDENFDDVGYSVLRLGQDAQGRRGSYTLYCLPGDLEWYRQRVGKRLRITYAVEVLDDEVGT